MGGDADVEIADLAYDSARVGPGHAVLLRARERSDGHDLAPDAVERGAVALVVERELDLPVPQVIVADVRAAMAPLAVRFWDDPSAELRVAGITGTNGKTTTAFLLRGILEEDGRPTGLLGTVKRIVGGVEEEVERTTPEAIDLQTTFRRMLDGGDVACAMEVSSHALALRPRRRDPLRRQGVHQPDPGPPRLPLRHGGLLPRQAARSSSRGDAAPRRPRSSTSTTPTARGSRPSFARRARSC